MAYEEAYKIIDEIKFGILSPQEIRRLSVVEIQTADTYDEDGAAIPSGLMDGRLGTLEPRQRCRTCGSTATGCPGHFGHIELAVPVIHVEFTKVIYGLLQAVCRNCGRILLSDGRINEIKKRMDHLREVMGNVPDSFYEDVLREAKRNKECPHCGAEQYKIEFEKPTIFREYLRDGAQRLTANMIRERFERIPDDDLRLIGFDPEHARPEWMILQVLPVPPVYVRPSITLESGIRSEDDLTHKLVDITRINQRLKENIEAGAPTLIIQDLSELLQYHVTTYFNNEASGIPPARHRSGRALKTLSQRLKGKEGRFRSNLSGKRVDFSARTVITPDPNLDINEVGVPLEIAMRLTVPEKVTLWNLERMRELVRNGPDKYPGALYIVRPDGKRVRLEFVTDREKVAEALEPDFIVERHLCDGDIVIFNRQPSLHRMSIMAHYVKVLPYKTFRLHLCVCPPYNADFDGDEMNLHVPQSEEAQTEARLLMQVQDHILSPRFGGPIIGAIRDFVTAAYLFTRKSNLLTKKEVCELLVSAGYEGPLPEPAIKEPEPRWTGKQIFSLFIPPGMNYTLKASFCRKCDVCLKENCKYDAYVVIKNGVLEQGVIDKNAIGAEKSESLLHRIIKDYGTQAGRTFLNKISKLLTKFITMRGFTYSYDELELSPEVKERIKKIIRKDAEKRIQGFIEALQKGTLERLPGQSLIDSFEIYVMNELSLAEKEAWEMADSDLDLTNAGILMTRSGARGSIINIGQMTACLGQQSVRGKRIMRGYLERALPHFKIGDSTPKARGFVYSSFRDGLDPVEFFFHAMGGREGLVDTAVRTQQSGYMQRRLINAMEHLHVEYDGTVRGPLGEIIQFRYGEDGVDPAKSDHGKAVNVGRLIDRIKLMMGAGEPAPKSYIEERLKEAEDKLTPLLIEELRKTLYKAELSREGVDLAIRQTIENYRMALVEPGEAIGIVAAQSIGEPGTQMTLRTFHYAGVREQNVTIGLPRLIEIVDARRVPSTPIMTIYLDEEHKREREKAAEVARRIVYTKLGDLASDTYIDPQTGGIVMKLDPNLMKDKGVTLELLKERIVVPDCSVRFAEDSIIFEPKKEVNLKRLLDKILSLYIKGIPGIKRVRVTEEEGEWIIRTEGSNLSEVLKVKGIDPTRTTTNNVHEIAGTLGIEAARNALIKEAMGVLEDQGLDVDIRHVMLVADIMTATGIVRQIGRHGISGEKASILAKAAFEITIPNIVEAAVRGGRDPLKGVTENVIVGQAIPIGTGLVDIYMSASQLIKGKDGERGDSAGGKPR
ncbi:MAG: DNA-directed RNA polymerase subunit A'/A'' [Candidatus Bathyarchaeota archaeon B26-1]|nr:MAG: DNA-directed RNA polymerase subunit A'/A'' [Candidatus Bathyarchaeota archaeon B26-1]